MVKSGKWYSRDHRSPGNRPSKDGWYKIQGLQDHDAVSHLVGFSSEILPALPALAPVTTLSASRTWVEPHNYQ